ncbi:MAG: ATP-binding protein [Syntrophobacteraceae bacterium]
MQDFAFIASHDLQEPLRKVQAFGDRVMKKYGEALGDRGRDYLERMIQATRRMSDMIKGLLDYSRLGTREKYFGTVDLVHVAREVENTLVLLIERTGARIEVGNLPSIEADSHQMRQLFQKLISNALKFHGEERAVIRVYSEPTGSKAHRISVEDNGIGFDEIYLDRIFTMFQRLHGRTYDGTGMGLAICRRIVESHHGSITARSKPEQVATFIITLPERQPAENW